MPIDVNREADKIEHMAKERLDTPSDRAGYQTQALIDEWASLSKVERDQVAAAIQQKYYPFKGAQPVPFLERDRNGDICGILFAASVFDFHQGPHDFELRAQEAAGGKETVFLKTNPNEVYDGVREEAIKLEKMAEEKLDTPIDKASAINKKICAEFLQLSQKGRNLLGEELFFVCGGAGTPTAKEIKTSDGNSIGLSFEASFFDAKPGPNYFEILGVDQADGKYLAATFTKSGSKDKLVCDSMIADSEATMKEGKKYFENGKYPSK